MDSGSGVGHYLHRMNHIHTHGRNLAFCNLLRRSMCFFVFFLGWNSGFRFVCLLVCVLIAIIFVFILRVGDFNAA